MLDVSFWGQSLSEVFWRAGECGEADGACAEGDSTGDGMAEVKGMKVSKKRLRAGFTILESLIMLVVLAILTLLLAGVIKTGVGGEDLEGAGVDAKVGVER